MDATAVRGKVTEQLLGQLEESRFLHVALMNRIEARIRTRDELVSYLEVLTAKLEEIDFRSESMIDRLDRMVDLLERLDRRDA